MKYLAVLITVIFIFSTTIARDNSPVFGKLIVKMINFENDEGDVRVHLYNSDTKKEFPAGSGKAFKLFVGMIHNNKSEAVFDSLPYGKYALAIHHDKNLDMKMNKNWLGMPAEGWGLSNNIIPVFSLPEFEECQFDVNNEKVEVEVKIRNLP